MTSRSTSALRKPTTQRKPSIKTSKAKTRPGKLPEWNLADLYPGIAAPEVARDLTKMDAECVAFETDYKGKLAEQTTNEGGGKWLPGGASPRPGGATIFRRTHGPGSLSEQGRRAGPEM